VVWPQNHWDGFFQFDLKIGGDSFFGLASKPMVEGFSVYASKLTASVL
jgi:hypothetical protein